MAAPQVQDLATIMAELDPAFAQTRSIYQQQQAQLPAQFDAMRAATEGKRVQGFQDIARGANSRGLDFWGTPIEEQNQYLSDVYLPGMQQADAQQRDQGQKLALALADIEAQKYTRGLDTRNQQQSAFQQWQQEQERRAHEERLQAQRIAADRAAQPPDPMDIFDAYIADQFQRSGGQGNRKITRKQQDQWVENWLNQKGISQGNRQAYWDQINTRYNRNWDASKDWRK